jgi:hypothetical protein
MNASRCLPFVLLAALSAGAQAQDAGAQAGGSTYSRPSTPSARSVPTLPSAGDAEGASVDGSSGTGRPGTPSPNARTPGSPNARGPSTQMLGAGAFGSQVGTGLENVLNSGTPPSYDRKSGSRKVCPPELENRNNVCVAPTGSVLGN